MATNGSVRTAPSPEERLLQRLQDPKTARNLDLILDKLDLVAFSLSALDGFLRRSDEIVEAVAEGVADFNKAIPGVTIGSTADTVAHIKSLFQVSIRLNEVLSSPEFEALMQSGILSPETVSVVGKAGSALTESYRASAGGDPESKKIGLFGLLRMLNDPDVQRSLHLLTTFAKTFGAKIDA
jgi:uncharacterized protein YjgD (DUF1641 family)